MKIGLAQINPTVGDLDGNAQLILATADTALRSGCELVVYPELVLPGYPPQDLLFKKAFIADQLGRLDEICKLARIDLLVGFVDARGADLFNAAAYISGGRIRQKVYKTLLPTYDVLMSGATSSPPVIIR